MLDNLSQEEIDLAYENAAKRRLMDDNGLTQKIVDIMEEDKLIPEELINEFKYPKEMEEPIDEAIAS